MLLGGLLPGAAQALPSYREVVAAHRPSETLVLAHDGQVLQRVRTNRQVRQGDWVALADVSAALRLALLASEDQRFYAHSGVDWQAVSAAAWGNLWHQKTRGASTITMQLAGLLDEDWRTPAGGRSLGQKLGQAVAATRLERNWRKDEILEAYLNLVPFRGELVGLDALSRTLFGKAAHGLDAQEAAIAAALIRGPNAKVGVVGQRACGVLQSVAAVQKRPRPDCSAVRWRTEQVLAARLWPASAGIAPHWAQRVLAQWPKERPGQALPARIATTLDADVQRVAVDSLERHLRELQGNNVEDGAVLVLDNASGQVLAWVGSSGSLSQAQEVDGVLAQRQPGSTLKPFLYAQALEQRRLTAASLIEDSAAHINTGAGLYIPQNYDRRFKGWVSARVALASSLNVPAVRTLTMVGVEDFYQQLAQFGLDLPQPAGYYGYSLALGSSEVDLLRLANAFRALANGGLWQPVAGPLPDAAQAPSPALPPLHRATSPQAAFIVGDILADSLARAPTFGLDSVLTTRFWSAVKTGTSKDMRDNWAIGWSQRYTVGVWVGNASGAAMHDVSGSSGAAPVWAEVMDYLHRQQPSRAPVPPSGVQQQWVRFDGQGLDADRQEWFVTGSAQTDFARAGATEHDSGQTQGFAPRILAPASGTILALDPDIPSAQQRLWLRSSSSAVRWRLNGRILGGGAQLAWLPMPGQHVLEIVDRQGRKLDAVTVQVRGAGLAAAAPRKP
ncbi:MAG: penicillin-binding protein 1C [Comamonas sp.]|nr:penicillin-binding protein 1C [Comamonas sp.]